MKTLVLPGRCVNASRSLDDDDEVDVILLALAALGHFADLDPSGGGTGLPEHIKTGFCLALRSK